jgi:hypothetical protein
VGGFDEDLLRNPLAVEKETVHVENNGCQGEVRLH